MNANDLANRIAELKAEKESSFVQLKQQLEEADALQSEINALNKTKGETLASEKLVSNAVTEAEKLLSQQKASIQSYNDLYMGRLDSMERDLMKIALKITYPDWKSDLPQTITRLKADAERFNQWQDTRKQLLTQINEAQIAQNAARKLCGQVMKLFPEWTAGLEILAVQHLDEAWQELFARASYLCGHLTDIERQKIDNQRIIDLFLAANAEIDLPRLTTLSALSHSQIEEKEAALNGIEKGLQTAKGALAQVKQHHEEHRANQPEMDEGATLENLSEQLAVMENTLTDLARQTGDLDGQIKANEGRSEEYGRQKTVFEEAEKEWLKWDGLCKIFGDREGKTFRVIAQSYVLRELLAHANTFLSHFSDRYELVCQNSLTILVRDLYFGGMARPVDLVSGGESFIVSLALALGLSSLNRNSLSADILFIDEGFGTLDPTVLEVVMSTLGKLQALGDRRVGVISHIEVLRERIPVKILVEKMDNTTSRIRLES
jgi:exonuclease SbcC